MFILIYLARRESEFTLGWSDTNQLNAVQARKTKNNEITGKVTNGPMPDRQNVLKPVNYRVQNEPSYSSPDEKWMECIKLYHLDERLMREYPDIPS
jgi:hypothetical protein